jgi:hypothetical protein
MAVDKMKEILKHFPDLEEGWKEMEEKLKTEPAEREMLSLKYREMLEMEKLEENLPEPEFTKAKRAESDSKVMKANAPEKIYVHEASAPELTENLPYHIEYTRTDAFIEKACEWLSKHAKKYYFNKEGHYLGTDELVEDFKIAMRL